MTLKVLKLDKSKDSNELQLKNIYPILVTWEVSKFDKSKDFNELQSQNIEFI